MGKTSSASKNKYNAKAYDRFALVLKKGQKDILKKCAEEQGISTNNFIVTAIEEKMQKLGYDLSKSMAEETSVGNDDKISTKKEKI